MPMAKSKGRGAREAGDPPLLTNLVLCRRTLKLGDGRTVFGNERRRYHRAATVWPRDAISQCGT